MKKSVTNGPIQFNDEIVTLAAGNGSGHGGGAGGGGGEGGGGGMGGGKPPGAGSKKGDLYGDQYVLLRDFDAGTANDSYTDKEPGDGDGEPLFDINGNPILLGSDGNPIYYVPDPAAEGDWILDPARAMYAQTIDLGRANVARAPDSVMQKSLTEALIKLEAAVDIDAAGRIVYDTGADDENGNDILATIDSPLENLALYQHLMTAGGKSSWTEVQNYWPDTLKNLLANDPDCCRRPAQSIPHALFVRTRTFGVLPGCEGRFCQRPL